MKKSISALLLAAASLLAFAPAQADTLADIKAKGEMVVGMEIAYKPFEFFQDGQAVGYDVDLIRSIADTMGVKVRTVDTAFAGIVPALLEKKFDLVISGMIITGDRLKRVNFSNPVALGSVVFLVRADDDRIKKAEDTSGKIVATQLGSAADRIAKAYQAKLVAAGKPGFADFKLYESFPDTFVELSNKRVDVVSASLPILQALMKERPGRFKIIDGITDLEGYLGIAMRKDDEALLAFVNTQIRDMKANGKLETLQKKWFGTTQPLPDTIPTRLP